jgi:acyl carrier protein
MSQDLDTRLAGVFREVFQVDITPGQDVRRDTLDAWDSVNHFRLVMELEQAFAVTLSDEEVTDLMSLADVTALMRRKLGDAGA